jgi:hypothetical protein
LKGEESLREISRRYRVDHVSLHRWVKGHGRERRLAEAGYTKEEAVGIGRLRRELEDARLTNELPVAMIDIAERIRWGLTSEKTWSQAVMEVEARRRRIGLSRLYGLLGYSRRAYYKLFRVSERSAMRSDLLVREVARIRADQKSIGARKLHSMLGEFMECQGNVLGRDAFFDLLREHSLLVRKRRKWKPRTTFSGHWMKRYPTQFHIVPPWDDMEQTVPDTGWNDFARNWQYLQ